MRRTVGITISIQIRQDHIEVALQLA
jgi:hypothetical protein